MPKTVVRVVAWSQPRPPAPNGSSVGGTDWYQATYEQERWPQDGSVFAGIVYETQWVRIGPEPGFYPVIVSHSNYPAEEVRVP